MKSFGLKFLGSCIEDGFRVSIHANDAVLASIQSENGRYQLAVSRIAGLKDCSYWSRWVFCHS